MVSDAQTIGVYDARAEEYADLTSGIAQDPRLIDFIERLPDGGRVLDLGCGPGAAAAVMAQSGRDVLAWDASQGMVELAARGAGVTAQHRVFDDLAELEGDSLAGVWANFSLLHASRAALPGYLRQIAHTLMPGGVFLMAVKSGEGEERDKIGRHYTYFTEEELRARLHEAGFTPVRFDQGRDTGLSGEDADWISLTCVV
ncbi:class I SAM-dependent DNA methyltransferase [Primorskyibacter sp. S187A]|uniref:class I SAM-dependent DNA methyltransferase n=1 Tax=Primorskyibacter sp. S187A TaxID=3415130 RepID=UPI003C7A636D